MPKRIQRRRTKGWKMPPNAVYVGRPTIFGNPFRANMWVGYTREDAVRDYRKWLTRDPTVRSVESASGPPPTHMEICNLRGKDLACWCGDGCVCHADVLLEIANK